MYVYDWLVSSKRLYPFCKQFFIPYKTSLTSDYESKHNILYHYNIYFNNMETMTLMLRLPKYTYSNSKMKA